MVIQWRITEGTEGTDIEGVDIVGIEGGDLARRRYISNSGRYYLPPGYYDAEWSYYTPSGKRRRSGRRKNSINWAGRGRFSAVGGAFGAMAAIDSWRMRGQYYDEYFKKTGKRPKYYNKVLRKKVKW